MKVKRTVAPDMRSAIRKVRQEQGPDAVILGNRKVAEGVEILSALDLDVESLDQLTENEELSVHGLPGTPLQRAPSTAPQPKAQPQPPQHPQAQAQSVPSLSSSYEEPTYERPRPLPQASMRPALEPRLSPQMAPPPSETPYLAGYPSHIEVDAEARFNAAPPTAPAPDRPMMPREPRENDPHVHLEFAQHRSEPPQYANAVPPASPVPASYLPPGPPPAAPMEPIRPNLPPAPLYNEAEQAPPMPHYEPPHSAPAAAPAQDARFEVEKPEAAAPAPAPAPAAEQRQAPAHREISGAEYFRSQQAIEEMRNEMQSLRVMMQNQMSAMDLKQLSSDNPIRLSLIAKLFDFGIGSRLARQISHDVKETQNLNKAWRQALGLLANKIPIADDQLMDKGGVVAMIGPTGVGKTTTIAKLAAKFAMRHGSDQVAFISTDTYRVGAQEQLNNYARILGVPVKQAANQEALSRALVSVMDRKLVLIDTAGASQRDIRISEQFAALGKSSPVIKPYLTISATTQLQVVEEIVKAFSDFDLAGCVLTKLDEAYGVGAALTAMIENNIPVAYLGTGQRVPEDLQIARAHRLVGRAFEEIDVPDASLIDAEMMAPRLTEAASHAQ